MICNQAIGFVDRVFANGLGDQGSILPRDIPKTQKMVLDASLLNPQHYKVWIKGKVEHSGERSSTFPYTAIEQGVDLDYNCQLYFIYIYKQDLALNNH